MLTFDRCVESSKEDTGLFGGGEYPDLIEIGENNDVWFKIRRSTKNLEIVSKVTGRITIKCRIDDPGGLRHCGMTPQQLGAAKAALKLGKRSE
jgi:hypothetical protein